MSWSREFLADRAAARVTGDPAALASALEMVDEAVSTPPDVDARSLELALVGDAEAPVGASDRTDSTRTVRLDQATLRPVVTHPSVAAWFQAHPSTAARVARLRDLLGDR